MRDKRVALNGVGTLQMHDSPPVLTTDGCSIAPPGWVIVVDETSADDVSITELIESDPYISTKKKKKLQERLEKQLNNFVNFSTFHLPGLGTIALDDGSLSFSPDDDSIHLSDEMQHLPAVHLSPVSATTPPAQDLPVSEASPETSVAYRKTYPSYDYSEPSSLIYWISGIGVGCIIAAWLLLRGCSSGDHTTGSSTETYEHTAIDTSHKYAYDHLMTPEIESEGCIIITGSYADPQNAQRAITLVESKGYSSHREKAGNFLRVGIRIPCYGSDLDSLLTSIQKGMETDAWYLLPRYDPE